jgi:hypothetical protein
MLSAMIPIISPVDAWWTRHPHMMELILLLIALLASLFPERSRRWLAAPLYYSALGAFRLTQRKAKRDLQIMRLIGDSTFNLVAYIGFYCISAAESILWSTVVFAILASLVSYWAVGHVMGVSVIIPLLVGGIIGRATRLKWLLGDLLDRDKSIARIEKIAAGDRP